MCATITGKPQIKKTGLTKKEKKKKGMLRMEYLEVCGEIADGSLLLLVLRDQKLLKMLVLTAGTDGTRCACTCACGVSVTGQRRRKEMATMRGELRCLVSKLLQRCCRECCERGCGGSRRGGVRRLLLLRHSDEKKNGSRASVLRRKKKKKRGEKDALRNELSFYGILRASLPAFLFPTPSFPRIEFVVELFFGMVSTLTRLMPLSPSPP